MNNFSRTWETRRARREDWWGRVEISLFRVDISNGRREAARLSKCGYHFKCIFSPAEETIYAIKDIIFEFAMYIRISEVIWTENVGKFTMYRTIFGGWKLFWETKQRGERRGVFITVFTQNIERNFIFTNLLVFLFFLPFLGEKKNGIKKPE